MRPLAFGAQGGAQGKLTGSAALAQSLPPGGGREPRAGSSLAATMPEGGHGTGQRPGQRPRPTDAAAAAAAAVEYVTAEFAAVEARAELEEVSAQLHVRERRQEDMEEELRALRSQLAAVRSELVTSEDSLLRAESRFDIQLAHRPPASPSRAAASGPTSPGGGARSRGFGEGGERRRPSDEREPSGDGRRELSASGDGRRELSASGARARDAAEHFAERAAYGEETSRLEMQRLLAERAELETRHTKKLALAEESVRAVQSQVRRKDAEISTDLR